MRRPYKARLHRSQEIKRGILFALVRGIPRKQIEYDFEVSQPMITQLKKKYLVVRLRYRKNCPEILRAVQGSGFSE